MFSRLRLSDAGKLKNNYENVINFETVLSKR